ncbi:MAG: endonuclease V [Nitrospirales bacterium]|nr:endonuclease V [Nitrospirales bacterium]
MKENTDMNLWPRDIQRAREVQEKLRDKVRIIPLKEVPSSVAGVDAAFFNHTVVAIASLYRYPKLEHLADAFFQEDVLFPYVPGFLFFREGHALMEAIKKLPQMPDLILFDGQGIAHPRGIGIASHIGVLLNVPTIGCAKTLLVGEFQIPAPRKGSWSPLRHEGKIVGSVLRTKSGVRPLFVSPGHLVDIAGAREIVTGCVTHFRIPEPLRRADTLSKGLRVGDVSEPRCRSIRGRHRG